MDAKETADRASLVKKLRACEQEIGTLRYKIRQRKDDKSDYNTTTVKLEKTIDDLRDDLKLAYENLETAYQDRKALKRAFSVMTLEDKAQQEFEKAMAK